MRILMLGWEFPPFIAGGLGVACYGLTKALDRAGHEVLFVLPKPVDRVEASHVTMLAPARPEAARTFVSDGQGLVAVDDKGRQVYDAAGTPIYAFRHATFRGVPSGFSNPYGPGDVGDTASYAPRPGAIGASRVVVGEVPGEVHVETWTAPAAGAAGATTQLPPSGSMGRGAGAGYDGLDLIQETERYMRLVVSMTRGEKFDVIHAHDWLTYPAGLAMRAVSGRPLVVHVHSTEFDRSGANVNQRVFDIEKAGMAGADRVLAVSQFTKNICVRRYGVPPAKVDVVYNGVERETQQLATEARIESTDKIVLFLGRITMQKGPEYFIAAAKRVLEKMDDVKFVLAGSGDMALRMIELAAGMGIGHKVLFTGFLRGRDVERVFKMADCYVMPSVSEPFGISALEAISHDVPVILSKTSGASEVLTHVLKVDFWDTDEMANKILAVLRHPPLSKTLREHGAFELHRLTWEVAAERCVASYAKALVPPAKA
jgi:glycosyltransferase involved in cell wall biosynthesis